MKAALYFPFTEPKSELFLKNALFLWDSVDFIVPWEEFRPHSPNKDAMEALEMVGRNYVPSDDDKKRIHEELMDFCTSRVPESLQFELDKPDVYDFYPQKLLPDTWDMLADSKLAKLIKYERGVRQASTTALFGYYMMSAVAVCCANGRKRLVTDESDPYRTLAKLLVDESPEEGASAENWHGRLVALTLAAPDLSTVPLSTLVHLRKTEDQLIQEMRRAFVDRLDTAVAEIRTHADNPNVIKDIVHTFTHSMEQDLKELKRALRRSAVSILLSPLGGVTVLTAVSAAVVPAANVVAVGGLAKSLMDYQDRRRKILSEHPSAWLFAGTREFKIY